MNKTVVVTGASGFIGTALCNKLEMNGYSIVKVTRSKNKEGFYSVNNYKESPRGDVLIHLGEDSNRARVNKIGNIYCKESGQAIEPLLRNRYEKIIYLSSSIVYGHSGIEPYKESSPTYSNDTYSKAKLKNEKKVLNANGTVVRLSNVIGEGMATNNVLSDIFKQLETEGPLIVHNMKSISDFILIDDVVDAIVQLIEKSNAGVVNIGTGVATSIHELIKFFLKINKQKNRKISSMTTNSGYSFNVVNIDKMRRILNWEPKNTLQSSMKNILNNGP
jgi:UDP-glucose 4-epimerase